jgi:hypothetical protein
VTILSLFTSKPRTSTKTQIFSKVYALAFVAYLRVRNTGTKAIRTNDNTTAIADLVVDIL